MKKVSTIGIIFGLTILLCGFGFAAANEEKRPDGPPPFFKKLNLSPTQEKQIQSIHDKQRASMKKQMDEVKKLHEQLDKELLNDTPDEKKVDNIIIQIKQAQSALIDLHFQDLKAIRQVLTTEQFKQMTNDRQKMRTFMEKRFKERNKKGGRPGPREEMPPPPPMMEP